MTEQLKPCPLPDCGGEAEFESPVQCAVVRCKSCGIALAKELNPSLYTGYDALKRAEKRWVIDRWNTRPSASREIAVKPLTFSDEGYAHNGLGTMYRITFHNDANIGWVLYRHEGSSKTGLGAHEDRDELITLACRDNERRILSAIDTTPGNTDPIAKYDDDELRKVQGGWRDFWDWWSEDGCAIDTDPDVSWYDKRRDFAEIAFEAGRISAPTEHPTEQPSVRDVLSKAANDAIQGYAERTDKYASGFRNGIFTMRKSILRSLAQEGE